jgi:hypothetical protein
VSTRTTKPAPLFEKDGTDRTYNNLRHPAGDNENYLIRGREFCENLWATTAEYLDADLPDKAAREFHQCFWEMYLAATLLDMGLPLVPRSARKKRDAGPDLQVGANVWVEAIAVTGGSGRDAIVPAPMNVASRVPDEQMKLRLIFGVDEKGKKFERYRENGLVERDDICIVALNAALVQPVHVEWHPPRIVRALMEFGSPVLVINRDTRQVVERTNHYQAAVTKASGSAVSQGMFHDGSCSAVSACLYSVAGILHDKAVLGCDFHVVHNPTAAVPLRRGFIQRGIEHWSEQDELVSHDYGPEQRSL